MRRCIYYPESQVNFEYGVIAHLVERVICIHEAPRAKLGCSNFFLIFFYLDKLINSHSFCVIPNSSNVEELVVFYVVIPHLRSSCGYSSSEGR